MRYSASIICAVMISVMTTSAPAEIPQMISYQGKVTDSGGTPVSDGNYLMRCQIFDVESGGSPLWDSGVRLVAVTDGIFNVLLGQSPQDPIDLPFDQDYWLQITVAGDDQIPRTQLGSVGYAYMASGLVPGTEISGSVANGSVQAVNTSTSGTAYGLYGRSYSSMGGGVYGSGAASVGSSYGVFGLSSSTAGFGVGGHAIATEGYTEGIYGISFSSQGTGAYGKATTTEGTTYGVWGESSSTAGTGVYGYATAFTGLTYGVYGRNSSSSGRAIYGHANAGTGTNYGVYGRSWSIEGTGVYGYASATSGTTYGVYGKSSSTDGYGVYFEGGVAGSGSKSCVVKTSQGPTLMYCQESTENWFEDFGDGRLINGRCHIDLDPLFLETVTIDERNPIRVFVTPDDPNCKGVAVIRGTTGFEIVELQSGLSDSRFAYRVVAKRKGFEEKRLDYCRAAETDSYLYPELREKDLREHEEERAWMEEERRRTQDEQGRMEEIHERMEAEQLKMEEVRTADR